MRKHFNFRVLQRSNLGYALYYRIEQQAKSGRSFEEIWDIWDIWEKIVMFCRFGVGV